MNLLRASFRRGLTRRYFEEMEPLDRAVALVWLAALAAWAVGFAAIVRARDPAVDSVPAFEPREIETRLASLP